MCWGLLVAALVFLGSSAALQDALGSATECMQIIHPPPNYVLTEEEHRSIELLVLVNCEGKSRARMLQLYSATGNGTAGGMLWQAAIDEDSDEVFQVAWQMLPTNAVALDAYEHWHCSGWRQWQLVVHRESGAREHALVRVRAPLLENALEQVERAAEERGGPARFVQVGAMDGIGHDHMFPFIAKGTWEGLLVEPLKDFYERLVQHYSRAEDRGAKRLQFCNMCVAESGGKRKMRRLAPGAIHPDLAQSLGYDGSSSLLAGARLKQVSAIVFSTLSL